uniref:Wsv078-like protein n=1 Tax=Pasiphaea japonica whispovirus TaxID=2984286 RepID=A0A9C7BJD9_9VIRU|nr:MAG: wsv078-like protein [Pasiphaea japonica whispovirus]
MGSGSESRLRRKHIKRDKKRRKIVCIQNTVKRCFNCEQFKKIEGGDTKDSMDNDTLMAAYEGTCSAFGKSQIGRDNNYFYNGKKRKHKKFNLEQRNERIIDTLRATRLMAAALLAKDEKSFLKFFLRDYQYDKRGLALISHAIKIINQTYLNVASDVHGGCLDAPRRDYGNFHGCEDYHNFSSFKSSYDPFPTFIDDYTVCANETVPEFEWLQKKTYKQCKKQILKNMEKEEEEKKKKENKEKQEEKEKKKEKQEEKEKEKKKEKKKDEKEYTDDIKVDVDVEVDTLSEGGGFNDVQCCKLTSEKYCFISEGVTFANPRASATTSTSPPHLSTLTASISEGVTFANPRASATTSTSPPHLSTPTASISEGVTFANPRTSATTSTSPPHLSTPTAYNSELSLFLQHYRDQQCNNNIPPDNDDSTDRSTKRYIENASVYRNLVTLPEMSNQHTISSSSTMTTTTTAISQFLKPSQPEIIQRRQRGAPPFRKTALIAKKRQVLQRNLLMYESSDMEI